MENNDKSNAERLVELLMRKGLTIATAESCTGGAVSQAITSVAGCSDVMLGAVVAYHNSVKSNILGVKEDTIEQYGAVSEETVKEMAEGIARITGSDCSIATSGIAGPGGGTVEKPVGTVWIASKIKGETTTRLLQLGNRGRKENIAATVDEVLDLIYSKLEEK